MCVSFRGEGRGFGWNSFSLQNSLELMKIVILVIKTDKLLNFAWWSFPTEFERVYLSCREGSWDQISSWSDQGELIVRKKHKLDLGYLGMG